jgi:hypothetical protein
VATFTSARRERNDSEGGPYRLLHDLEAVFLDNGIGQNFLGDALELRLSLATSPAVEIQHEEFALADVSDAFIAEARERMVDGLTLRIEDGAFWHDPDVCFHAGSITFRGEVIEALTVRKEAFFATRDPAEEEERFVDQALFWREEDIVGRIGDAEFLADVVGVASRRGGLAAFGVDALERGDRNEDACPAVTYDLHQQPWDGASVGGRGVGSGFAGNAATVGGFPRGSGEMFAEWLAVFVEEVRVGLLQRPAKLRAVGFASVDLVALSMDLQE